MSKKNLYQDFKSLSHTEIAVEILDFWNKNKIFQKSIENRKNATHFTFYEGPPSANGLPGIHHVMARAIKDIFCRFWTLKGYQVNRKGGWDTHGLPVELQVEKELKITKEDIGNKISVEEYNQKCKSSVMTYKVVWDDLTEKMGYWVDLDNPYVTFNQEYMETLWHLLKRIYDKKMLYKGYTIQPYSPAAGTGLSSHELNQPGCYKLVKDTSITAQFQLLNHPDTYFLAWTTTPWTLPANSALAVGKNIDYLKVATFNPYTFLPIKVILAKNRLETYFSSKNKALQLKDYQSGDKKIPFKIIEEMKGSDLIGQEFKQLMPYISLPYPAFTVIEGDFVTTEDGTGIVHIARAFGSDDDRVCQQHNIPGIFIYDEKGLPQPIVDKKGCFVKEITDFAGMPVKNYNNFDESNLDYKSTDVRIAIKLKEENKAFKVEKYEHSYPHCWRTDKPILYYPLDSWFIKTTAVKDRMIALNKEINWKPSSVGEGRFGHWLENLVDWNLSRTRYWGTPLPIWRTKDSEEEKCIGSLEELKIENQKALDAGIKTIKVADDFDFHRPNVDKIILLSEKGQPMYRENDLIDVWFDSGAMPYAQWHYPFKNKSLFEQNFPADFIAEGIDQTRGWFFTLHTISVILFDKISFKNVIANGLVLDKDGNKMSKRLGNVIDPFTTFEKYGPDATRWYMIANANPWDNLKFDLEGVLEVKKRFFGTLQNTYNFFALYANLDEFDYFNHTVGSDKMTEPDRWILSKLHSLIDYVDENYKNYEPTRVARKIENFLINDLSNWYVRLNRKRFWMGKFNENKKAAFSTLHRCLYVITQLSSPIIPFYSDKMYQMLTQSKEQQSVHLTDFPKVEKLWIDTKLEEKVTLAQTIASLAHSLRKKHKIKVRQPLNKILLPIINDNTEEFINDIGEQIKSEINVKKIDMIPQESNIIQKKAKANFKILGKKFGNKMKDLAVQIANLTNEEIIYFQKNSNITVDLNNEKINLSKQDIEVVSADVPGFSVVNEGLVTVALDITLDDKLIKEGLARELVNKLQNLRKNNDFDVQDKINLYYSTRDLLLNEAIEEFKKYIAMEVQANEITQKGIEDFNITNLTHAIELEDYTVQVNLTNLGKIQKRT